MVRTLIYVFAAIVVAAVFLIVLFDQLAPLFGL